MAFEYNDDSHLVYFKGSGISPDYIDVIMGDQPFHSLDIHIGQDGQELVSSLVTTSEDAALLRAQGVVKQTVQLWDLIIV